MITKPQLPTDGKGPANPPWMRAFGGLRDLHGENQRIDKLIEEEFGRIDEQEWR